MFDSKSNSVSGENIPHKIVRKRIALDMENNELATVIVMNAPFGEYGEMFDDNGNVTHAHNGDYKPKSVG